MSNSNSDALARIRRGRRPSSVEPRVDPLSTQGPIQLISLSQIVDRLRDTRPINIDHVAQLMESMRVVGLITPLTVDRELTLLAGAHRLEAMRRLSQESTEDFLRLFPEGRVPARVMQISAQTDQLLALRVEVEENEKRRDYTAAEVFDVAQTLEAAGFTRARGRPNAGERPLIPALEAIFGKSKATIKRYLSQEEEQESHENALSSSEHSVVDSELYMWQVTQEKCQSFARRAAKLESEVKRALIQWRNEEEMKNSPAQYNTLVSGLEASLQSLGELKNYLDIKVDLKTKDIDN